MYFAMDEIGFENETKIKTIDSEPDKWKFIYDIARVYGFEGIHITPSLYNKFGLDINNMPEYFQDFKLTCHLGGMWLIPKSNYEEFENKLKTVFKNAVKHKIHDISIHSPYIHGLTQSERDLSLELFNKIINKWLKILIDNGISLSLETHIAENIQFNRLNEYIEFINKYPELGVLVDISHNYYEPQCSEDEIINIFGNKNIKGFHISDSLRNVDIKMGTHLAIGEGKIDFSKILKKFNNPEIYGVLEIKASNEGISQSLKILKNILYE